MPAPTDEAHKLRLLQATARPAFANERVQTNAAAQVVFKLKAPWRDGITHLVLWRDTNSPVDCSCQPKGPSSARARPASLSPLAFMQRLAALVPRPKLHLTRCGVRITSLRELSVPPLRAQGVLAPDAKPRALVVPHKPEPPAQAALPAECQATCAHYRPMRLSRAKLLKRVFEIDMELAQSGALTGVR